MKREGIQEELTEKELIEKDLIEKEAFDQIVSPLCAWYEANRRMLPWRETRDPYRIWVSEIMLQQTRVEAVIPFYERFMQALPDLAALAFVSEEVLLKLWEGLGYYSRARNLKKAALTCVERYEGRLPASYEQLLELAGIGSYTAGAVYSIAFGGRRPAVDGNVLRVMHRILAREEDIGNPAVKRKLEEELCASMERTKVSPGLYNQALMELGACICIPNGAPHCPVCPVSLYCQARRIGAIDRIPCKAAKKARVKEERVVLIITDGEYFVIRRRPDSGLLAGLYEPPCFLLEKGESPEGVLWKWEDCFDILQAEPLPAGKHIFTHIEWHMKAWRICPVGRLTEYRRQLEEKGYLLASAKEMREAYSIPNAYKTWRSEWEE